jgi:hypothetical protein
MEEAQRCIDNIERIVAQRGGKICEPQRHLVAHCLRMAGTTTTLRVPRAGAHLPAADNQGVSAGQGAEA